MTKRKERTRVCTTDYCKIHVRIPLYIYNTMAEMFGHRHVATHIRDLVVDRYKKQSGLPPNHQYELWEE